MTIVLHSKSTICHSVAFVSCNKATSNPEYQNDLEQVGSAWTATSETETNKDKQGKQQKSKENDTPVVRKGTRNYFYEDIFRLPQDADEFIQKILLTLIPDLYPASKDGQSVLAIRHLNTQSLSFPGHLLTYFYKR